VLAAAALLRWWPWRSAGLCLDWLIADQAVGRSGGLLVPGAYVPSLAWMTDLAPGYAVATVAYGPVRPGRHCRPATASGRWLALPGAIA
jgi:hypothetical protein